jgi:integrase
MKRSRLTAQLRDYLSERRSLGFKLETPQYLLKDFVRFARRRQHHGPLTTDLMLQWVSRNRKHSAKYRAERLSILRGFARYLAVRDGKTEVPAQRLLGSGYRRQQLHIYTDRQLGEFLHRATQLPALYPLRPQTYATLFGLLASTGLRISEALHLRRTDVGLDAGILHIRGTKFRKSRLVPLHPTTTRTLRRYAWTRDRDRTTRSSEVFFVGPEGQPLPYNTVRGVFRRLCAKLQWHSNGTLPRPRIHDLRHSFACRRLRCWYREGIDVDRAMASLSTYLGHGKVTDTYWYLTGT